jgi:hypothetical protein
MKNADSDSIYFTLFIQKLSFSSFGTEGRQQYSIGRSIRQLEQLPLGQFLSRISRTNGPRFLSTLFLPFYRASKMTRAHPFSLI